MAAVLAPEEPQSRVPTEPFEQGDNVLPTFEAAGRKRAEFDHGDRPFKRSMPSAIAISSGRPSSRNGNSGENSSICHSQAPRLYTQQVSSTLTPASVPRSISPRCAPTGLLVAGPVAPHQFRWVVIDPILEITPLPLFLRPSDHGPSALGRTAQLPRCPYCQSTHVVAPTTRSTYSRCDSCGQVWHPDRLPQKSGGRR